ncbi:MAG TPA: FeoA family protein [Haloplasmataceae bacterium]
MANKVQKTLEQMEVGETGRILALNMVNKETCHRMLDIGIAPNAEVEVIHTLYGKALFIIDVDDVEVCIRREAARYITVSVG